MWNHIKDKMPFNNNYVIGFTPFCKYKCLIVFWNGSEWRSAEDKTKILNISYWQELPNTDNLK